MLTSLLFCHGLAPLKGAGHPILVPHVVLVVGGLLLAGTFERWLNHLIPGSLRLPRMQNSDFELL